MALPSRLAQLSSRAFQTQNVGFLSNARASRSLTTIPLQRSTTESSKKRPTSKSRLLFYASSAATVAAIASHSFPNALSVAMADYSTAASVPAASASTVSEENVVAASTLPDIVLYQFEVCPFCNKVRAFLDFHNIPYRVVEVDPLRKTELKKFSSDYRKVPIALVDGQQVNGSAAVIAAVQPSSTSSTSTTEQRWLKWLDDHLVHLIAPNIYRSPSESLQTFNYITDKSKFSMWERATIRYTGAAAMYMIGKRLKKKYAVDDERAAIHAAAAEWMGAVGETDGVFLMGDKPGVADLSVYGVMKAIETFDTFADLRENTAFAEWFDRMKKAVGEPSQTREE